jgi:hypothetical protein
MKHIICLLSILLVTLSCRIGEKPKKKEKCSASIYLDEYDIHNYFNCSLDTVVVKHKEKEYAKIILFDCKGAMHFEGYKDGTIYVIGNYISAKKAVPYVITHEDIYNPGEMKTVKEKSYKPLRNGDWKYYNSKGNIVAIRTYNAGTLIKTDSIK